VDSLRLDRAGVLGAVAPLLEKAAAGEGPDGSELFTQRPAVRLERRWRRLRFRARKPRFWEQMKLE
jgi:hypothetical protein